MLVTRSDGVLTISLNDVASRNVLSVALMRAFLVALDQAERDEAVRVVVVTNAGPVFCAGADLKAAPDDSAPELFASLLRRIQLSTKPIIGRIAGHAMGGGVGLAAAFDIAVASDQSMFGFSEVRLGVVPAVISAICLPKMRRADALESFLRGNRFDAGRASQLGLISRAVPHDAIDDEIAAIVADLLLGGPLALATAKRIVGEVPRMTVDDALAVMTRLSAEIFAGPEARAGTQAFRERRPPPWVK